MKNVSRWAVNTVEGLPTYISGRVAILGDAVRPLLSEIYLCIGYILRQAHAMTPHCASGAGQAIEVCSLYHHIKYI